MGIIALIFSIIVFCVFIGMFMRLGRIEAVLKLIALNRGAIKEERVYSKVPDNLKYYQKDIDEGFDKLQKSKEKK